MAESCWGFLPDHAGDRAAGDRTQAETVDGQEMIPKGRAYQDEDFAKELHRHLKDQLSGLCADAEVSYAWSGVHWECLVRRGDRTTNIFCFEARRPRYCISFQENAREAGTALASKAEVLAAVSEWILGGPFEALYDKFDFVGRVARELAAIRDEALALAPELNQLMPPELRPMPDPYELWFRVEVTCLAIFGPAEA
jgi:hypothetical protein